MRSYQSDFNKVPKIIFIFLFFGVFLLPSLLYGQIPVADFTGNPTSGYVPLTVQFTDTSTGTVTNWSWDFGDTGTSTEQNPSHPYSSAGTYTVTLTVTGPEGSDIETKIDYIIVSEPPPVADFSGTPLSGVAPLLVTFTDQSTDATTWSWNFGDGVGTSTERHPSYTYNNPGSYTVTLTVTGPGGSDQEIKTNYITVNEPPPDANFTGNPTSGYVPLAVQFTDTSTGNRTEWFWEFGDGRTSNKQNPSTIYLYVGTYTVTLTATGPGGSDSETKVNYITVSYAPPIADFTGTPTTGVKPLTVQFTDKSQKVVNSWYWDFGDGATSTERNPYHTYMSVGTYTVSLTATGPGGSNIMQKIDYIYVTDIIVDNSPANVNRPQVTADGNGHVYVVWEDIRNGSSDIYFNYSEDYGISWQSTDIRLDTDTPGANHSRSPQIACDNNGHVYVVWEDERNDKLNIYFNYSSDYGVTWRSSDKKLSSALYAPHRNPKIACDNSGHVYIAWNDNYFNTSADNGATWLTQAIRISTTGGIETKLTCDQNGHVYVAWRTSDILFNYSSNFGNTWQQSDKTMSDVVPIHAIPYGFSLASDESGNIYFAWDDGRNSVDYPDIYFNSCSDYGNICRASSDIKLNTGTPGNIYSIWPEVVCDEAGNVYVAWYDMRNGLGDIYLNYSSNYGVNWQASDIRLDTDSPGASDSGYPSIASDNNGHIYVAWSDDQAGIGPGLYINYSLDYGNTWLSTNRKLGNDGFNPQIVTDGSRFYIIWDNTDIFFNEVAPLQVPPFAPADPTPSDGAIMISRTPLLSWRGGDANLDDTLTYDVYFDTASPPQQLVSANQSTPAFLLPTDLAYYTDYYWQVIARDNSGAETPGPIWSFKTMSGPPVLSDFSPPDGATGIIYFPTLSWNAFDPDGDTITYDVYFGKTNPPTKQATNWTSNTYSPGQLSHYTVYYWKIVARDSHGSEAVGPILSFTTINHSPIVSNPTPVDGATGVFLSPTLSWSAADPDYDDTLTYDVYFGTSSPPPLVVENQTTKSYRTGLLYHMTTYYWKVVAEDNHGASTESSIYSFTTQNTPPRLLSFWPPHTSTKISPSPTLQWSASDADPDDTLTYDLYFGTTSSPPLVLSNQPVTSYQPGKLAVLTRYYWKVVVRDHHGAETSMPVVYYFNTAASEYPQLGSFSPSDGATGIDYMPTLSWTASDPDLGDVLNYDVYFGYSSSPPLVASRITSTTYQPGPLMAMQRYYWKIVARDNHGVETVGPLLSLTTGNSPPQLLSFSPADLSINVSLNPKLKWTPSAPEPGDLLSYDVYFGTSPLPPLVFPNKTLPNYQPGTLLPLTVYYWQIVVRDSHGAETIGPILSFTTANPPHIDSISPNPCNTLQIVSIFGANFGDTQGSSEIHLFKRVFGPGSSAIIMWSDTRIDFKVPAYRTWPRGTTKTLNLWVVVNGIKSNKVPLTITRP